MQGGVTRSWFAQSTGIISSTASRTRTATRVRPAMPCTCTVLPRPARACHEYRALLRRRAVRNAHVKNLRLQTETVAAAHRNNELDGVEAMGSKAWDSHARSIVCEGPQTGVSAADGAWKYSDVCGAIPRLLALPLVPCPRPAVSAYHAPARAHSLNVTVFWPRQSLCRGWSMKRKGKLRRTPCYLALA